MSFTHWHGIMPDTSDNPRWPAVRHCEARGAGLSCMYVFVIEVTVLELLDFVATERF